MKALIPTTPYKCSYNGLHSYDWLCYMPTFINYDGKKDSQVTSGQILVTMYPD